MKKILIVLFIVAMSCIPFSAQKAQASPYQFPRTVQNRESWQATPTGPRAFGFHMTWQVSSPGLSPVSQSYVGPSYWHRRFVMDDLLDNDDNGAKPILEIGLEKVRAGDSDPYCQYHVDTDTLFYYDQEITLSGYSEPAHCTQVPSGDINQDTSFFVQTFGTISPYCPIGTSGFFFFWTHTTKICNQLDMQQDLEYTSSSWSETWAGDDFDITQHKIEFGNQMTQVQWFDNNGNWRSETQPGGDHIAGCSGQGCPQPQPQPLMAYWEDGHYPMDNNPAGGIEDICIYPSYGNYPWCTIGG